MHTIIVSSLAQAFHAQAFYFQYDFIFAIPAVDRQPMGCGIRCHPEEPVIAITGWASHPSVLHFYFTILCDNVQPLSFSFTIEYTRLQVQLNTPCSVFARVSR